MRTLVLAFALALPLTAHAWQCPLSTGLWTPSATLAPSGPLVVRTSIPLHLAQLLEGKPRFVDANGVAVPAKVVGRSRDHAVLQPATPLPVGAQVGLAADNAPAWPLDLRWQVAPPPAAPTWQEDPIVVQSKEEDQGLVGLKWWRSLRITAPGAGLVRATLRSEKGKSVTRDLPVTQGRTQIGGDFCGSTFPVELPPGDYTLELTLLDGAGQPGETRSLPFVIPDHGLPQPGNQR